VVIGKSRVTTQDIMRAMVARLLTIFARKMTSGPPAEPRHRS
jgi:hypothetical protein